MTVGGFPPTFIVNLAMPAPPGAVIVFAPVTEPDVLTTLTG